MSDVDYRFYWRFLEGGGLTSEGIKLFGRMWTTHTELFMPDLPTAGKTFGALVNGGVIWRPADGPDYQNLRRVLVRSNPVTPEQFARGMQIIEKVKGEQYNELGVAAFALGEIVPVEAHLFCSQFFAFFNNAIGILPLAFDPATYAPGHALQMHMQFPGSQEESNWELFKGTER